MVTIPITIPGSVRTVYPVIVGSQILIGELAQITRDEKIVVFVDESVATYHSQILQDIQTKHVYVIDAREKHKHIEMLSTLWSHLHVAGANRKTIVVNIGGGVMGDVGGFAAATYMRGVRFVQVPTTLLSMVDASVGGKTGMNHAGVKNLVGSFQQPISVTVDTDFLQTLPSRELASGFSEMVKHGLIADSRHYDHIQSALIPSPQLISESIQIKKSVVESDPTEQGLRKILNFGHTIGHALEAYSYETDSPLLHGEAIALGMLAECAIAEQLTGLDPRVKNSLTATLAAHQLPTRYPAARTQITHLIRLMRSDKKNTHGMINMSLIERIGSCRWDVTVSEDLITSALANIF